MAKQSSSSSAPLTPPPPMPSSHVIPGIMLYSASPFYAHPLKFLAFFFAGSKYSTAYAHFRRDHQDVSNLAYHCCCLLLQLTFNLAFLACVDDVIGPLPLHDWWRSTTLGSYLPLSLSSLTVLIWSAILVTCPSPSHVSKLLSVALLSLAYVLRGQVVAVSLSHLIYLQPLLDVCAYGYVLKKPLAIGFYSAALAVRLAWNLFLQGRIGALRPALDGLEHNYRVALTLGAFVLIAFLSHRPFLKPLNGVFGPFLIFGHVLSFLSSHPLPFLWGMGFLATALQGVSHRETKEEATLPQLANVPDELSHATFFPVLLLQSCGDTLMGKGKKVKA